MERRLEELDREVNDLTVKIGVALDNWLKAQDAHDKAYLEKVYEDLKGEKHLLNTRRAKLEEKLPSSGEHSVQTAAAKAALAAAGTSAQTPGQTPGHGNIDRADIMRTLCLLNTHYSTASRILTPFTLPVPLHPCV